MTQPEASAAITGCLLAGGEGRRMNGQDKGLVPYRGRPMADWVLQSLAAQTSALMVIANRNTGTYSDLLRRHHQASITPQAGDSGQPRQASRPDTLAKQTLVAHILAAEAVLPDDEDLPPFSGPLAGILTALRRCPTDWLLVAPCDVPHLPLDLVATLMTEAVQSNADIVVPLTRSPDGTEHLHWVCALVHKRVCPQTETLFVTGERKIGNWVRAFPWAGVSFPDEAAFTNMNTPETLHGRA